MDCPDRARRTFRKGCSSRQARCASVRTSSESGCSACLRLQSSREGPGAALYDAPATQATYARLLAAAHASLDGGWPTIVDAAFLAHDERAAFAALASTASAPFSILDCRGSLPLLRQRVRSRQQRGNDASEADIAVLDRLSTVVEPLDAQESQPRDRGRSRVPGIGHFLGRSMAVRDSETDQ